MPLRAAALRDSFMIHTLLLRSLASTSDVLTLSSSPMSSVKANRKKAEIQVPEHVRIDASALVQLLSEFTQKVNALRSFVQELTQRIVDGELQTSKGISLLEVKSHLLLQYCVNLGCLLLQKLDGQSIAGHAVVKQLIVLRVYLEKIRPIDQKLKYQVDKMLKTASVGQLSSGPAVDPLHFRPNPAALLARTNQPDEDDAEYDDEHDDDENGDAGHSGSKKSDVYRPPMMEAVYYHEDERADKKQNARREKELAKVSNSSMMQQLREEFSDRPTEKRVFGVDRPVQDEFDRVRTEYEEENMVRLPVTRADKRKRKLQAKEAMGGGKTLAQEFSEQFADLERLNRIRPQDRNGGGRASMANALDSFKKQRGNTGMSGRGRGGRR